jgi:hypothetical protein
MRMFRRDPRRSLRKTILAFPPESRAAMLRVLAAEPVYRAEAIRRLYAYAESREMAELLMDLEANRSAKADVM